jgi:pilus assembly protein Flp/PilA
VWRKDKVNNILLKLYVRLQDLLSREEGQDMVEYALIVGLISLGCTATSKFLAQGLSSAYSNLSSGLATYTS